MKQHDRPLDRLKALNGRVDAEFAALHERNLSRMQCRPGCRDCCRARLSVSRIEALLLREGLAAYSASRRAEFAARTTVPGREMCPALDDDGRCGVYEFRPTICRSFGAPLRHRHEVPLVNPPIVDCCDLNFTGHASLRTLAAEDILEQSSYVAELDRIDRDHCTGAGLPQAERISLASILG